MIRLYPLEPECIDEVFAFVSRTDVAAPRLYAVMRTIVADAFAAGGSR